MRARASSSSSRAFRWRDRPIAAAAAAVVAAAAAQMLLGFPHDRRVVGERYAVHEHDIRRHMRDDELCDLGGTVKISFWEARGGLRSLHSCGFDPYATGVTIVAFVSF